VSNDFTYRYAIQLPNGELLMKTREFGLPSLARMFGVENAPEDTPRPQTWDTREAAQSALDSIRTDLASKGIEWVATIVQSLCTPFTVVDPGEHFADEVGAWLHENGGL